MSKQIILRALQQAEGYLSGEELAKVLGISRAAVWKAINTLRREGYEIASQGGAGYRLCATPDVLTESAVMAQLGTHPWQVIVLPTVDSTNTALKRMAADGASGGTVLIAGAQTGGRGRLGRSFSSPAGLGLYLSVLLRPKTDPAAVTHATLRAGLATADAIETVTGLRPGIKWPNDLVWGNRKLCGILCEMSVEADSGHLDWLVIGIGVNCSHTPEDFPPEIRNIATSLRQICDTPVLRAQLAAELIRQLSQLEDDLTEPERYLPRYAAGCVTLGREVQLARAGQVRHAVAEDIAADGGLIVRLDNGSRETVSSGEASIRGMYGYVE